MITNLAILLLCPLLNGSPRVNLQETGRDVFDVVALPSAWTGQTGWEIHFRETWTIDRQRPAIRKIVENWIPRNDSLGQLSADSLKTLFTSLVRMNLAPGETTFRADMHYEFLLLDPHAAGSGITGFVSPDSMDRETRDLQKGLIGLLDRSSRTGSRFDLEEQLLSVWFRETWELDPTTREFTREVGSVTPVLWQRRQTSEGETIDEPGSGYPVYYKNRLQPFPLRNP